MVNGLNKIYYLRIIVPPILYILIYYDFQCIIMGYETIFNRSELVKWVKFKMQLNGQSSQFWKFIWWSILFDNNFKWFHGLEYRTLNTINCICNKSAKPCLRCIQLQYTIIYVYSIIKQIIMNAIKVCLMLQVFIKSTYSQLLPSSKYKDIYENFKLG